MSVSFIFQSIGIKSRFFNKRHESKFRIEVIFTVETLRSQNEVIFTVETLRSQTDPYSKAFVVCAVPITYLYFYLLYSLLFIPSAVTVDSLKSSEISQRSLGGEFGLWRGLRRTARVCIFFSWFLSLSLSYCSVVILSCIVIISCKRGLSSLNLEFFPTPRINQIRSWNLERRCKNRILSKTTIST